MVSRRFDVTVSCKELCVGSAWDRQKFHAHGLTHHALIFILRRVLYIYNIALCSRCSGVSRTTPAHSKLSSIDARVGPANARRQAHLTHTLTSARSFVARHAADDALLTRWP